MAPRKPSKNKKFGFIGFIPKTEPSQYPFEAFDGEEAKKTTDLQSRHVLPMLFVGKPILFEADSQFKSLHITIKSEITVAPVVDKKGKGKAKRYVEDSPKPRRGRPPGSANKQGVIIKDI